MSPATVWVRGVIVVSALALSACASVPAVQYQTSLNASVVLGAGEPARGGSASAAKGVNDRTVGMRGAAMESSSPERTFSSFIRDAVIAELKAAGRYSDEAPRQVSVELLKHDVSMAGIKTGHATLTARFRIEDKGAVRFDRVIEVRHEWESSFIGAVAIRAGLDNYPTAVQRLIEQLFVDPEFQQALQ
ncbi:hypothetical protein [Aquimonas sp.]|jgi:hypothetical protein|uniref:hypothetical protein n=1 Tax=Aquimonas sp. TaxID=1872588 RepID=UPI0037C19381